MSKHPAAALVTCLALTLSSCAVGPDFVAPVPPSQDAPHAAVETLPTDLGDQGFTLSPVNRAWWRQFGPDEVDAWVREALDANTDLRATKLALERSRDVLAAQTGLTWWPSLDLSLVSGRQRGLTLPGLRPPTVLYDTVGATVGASYVLDLFGGERRGLEASRAQVQASAAEYDAARLGLVANVVAGAVQLSALAARIELAERAQQALDELTAMQASHNAFGGGTTDMVEQARRQSSRQAQALPTLRSALRRQRAAIALLLGRPPEQAPSPIAFSHWHLPREVPLDLPATALQARPDVAVAQARLHAATARYGAAIANLYPQVQLNADWGRESYHYADLLGGPAAVWHVVGGLTQPLFRGGALEAAKRAAGADREIALASYVGTVLQALRTVADARQALVEDAALAVAAQETADASAHILQADGARAETGSRPRRVVEVDRVQWLADEDSRVAAELSRYVDTVAYLQSLSGAEVFEP